MHGLDLDRVEIKKRGNITERLTSCLTGLNSTKLGNRRSTIE